MAHCRRPLASSPALLVVLLVTLTLAAAAKRSVQHPAGAARSSQHGAARTFVQQYSPPLASNGPYRRLAPPPPGSSPRQIQQWQIAVNIPPGAIQQGPGPDPAPGHIWVQIPVSGYPAGPQPIPVAPQPPAPQPLPPVEGGNGLEGPVSEESHPPAIDSDPEKLRHCREPRGQFAHPSECEKFYNCWDGFVAEQACPGGLVFSDQGPFCDYVENVDCSQRGGAPPPPPTTQPPPQQGAEGSSPAESPAPEEEEEEGGEGEAPASEQEVAEDVGEGCRDKFSRYRSPSRCDVFIVCDNGKPNRFKCPATLHYNEELGICDYPYRVDCGTSAPSDSALAAPQPPAPEAPAPEDSPAPAQVPEDVLRYYGGFQGPAQRPAPEGYFRQG